MSANQQVLTDIPRAADNQQRLSAGWLLTAWGATSLLRRIGQEMVVMATKRLAEEKIRSRPNARNFYTTGYATGSQRGSTDRYRNMGNATVTLTIPTSVDTRHELDGLRLPRPQYFVQTPRRRATWPTMRKGLERTLALYETEHVVPGSSSHSPSLRAARVRRILTQHGVDSDQIDAAVREVNSTGQVTVASLIPPGMEVDRRREVSVEFSKRGGLEEQIKISLARLDEAIHTPGAALTAALIEEELRLAAVRSAASKHRPKVATRDADGETLPRAKLVAARAWAANQPEVRTLRAAALTTAAREQSTGDVSARDFSDVIAAGTEGVADQGPRPSPGPEL